MKDFYHFNLITLIVRLLLILSVSCWFSQNLHSQTDAPCLIPYANNSITIDGLSDDWDMTDALTLNFTGQGHPYDNSCFMKLAWDDLNLYGIYLVRDIYLVGLENPKAYHRLHYNDGIEFYIDSRNNSRDKMDIDDYQFLIDCRGNSAIFKGDRLDMMLKHNVPKEWGIANITFQCAAVCTGTMNKMNDLDSGYVVEFAISWSSIGVRPSRETTFKIDFCVNDNDTLVDFHSLPPGPVDHYVFQSIKGSHDFGFPANWISAKLTGKPSFVTRLQKKYNKEWLYLFFLTFVLAIFILIYFSLRVRQLKNIPEKITMGTSPLLDALFPETETPGHAKSTPPVILKAREYVLTHVDRPVQAEELAREMAVSLRQLQRIFREHLDSTPITFIVLIKLEKAATLLKEGNTTIAEAAYQVGFNDPAYFSRVFKKYFNITPSTFLDRKKG